MSISATYPNPNKTTFVNLSNFGSMAQSLKHSLLLVAFLICLSSMTTIRAQEYFAKRISREMLGLKREKLTHLHFYFHDVVSGSNPTAVRVAKANMTDHSPTGFGFVVMLDDCLTMGPKLDSKVVGRAQGIYASAAQEEVGLLMVLNFVFTQGKYNGSTLSVLGRNEVFSDVRELPIVGGSGLFRFARGYARAKTHLYDLKTGDAIVDYNVYVFHY